MEYRNKEEIMMFEQSASLKDTRSVRDAKVKAKRESIDGGAA